MRRRLLAAASLLAFAGLAPGLAHAGEQDISPDAQSGVAVTIYNQDLALVRDVRTIDLTAGENDIAFIDVSGHIQPETALLKSSRGRLDVLEQNFDFDLLTPGEAAGEIGRPAWCASSLPIPKRARRRWSRPRS